MQGCISCGSAQREFVAENKFFSDTEIVRCTCCGLIYPFPRPDREQVVAFYRDSYFTFDSFFGRFMRRLKVHVSGIRARYQFDWIKKTAEGAEQGRVLEIGCSYGRILEQFARDGWKVTGIEPSADAAGYTSRKFSNRSGRIVHGTFEEFDPCGEAYDCIVLSHVFEHFIAPEEVIERIKSMLSPGGYIFFELPNAEAKYYSESGYTVVPDFYYFNRDNFASFLRSHDLEVISVLNLEFRRLLPWYNLPGDMVNFSWWSVLNLFGIPCLRRAGGKSIWLRALARKPHLLQEC